MKGILRRANYTAGLPVVEGFMLEGFNYSVLYVRLKYILNPPLMRSHLQGEFAFAQCMLALEASISQPIAVCICRCTL